ncbi:MAG: Crp/Fnr family transcriptional regulator [Paracoccaceae bacterium]|nr:Crp/Fnr family transcriptional regulator [Paracoccaceae bacterium]MDG1372065.1 Crp/Fnr family transcriptional regulator [Paracoccaceae bacterium]
MSLNKAVEAMQQTPIFAGIDPKRLRLLAFMSESLTYRAGELLFDQGDEGDSAFVVIDGSASVLINIGGEKKEVAVIGSKQIFGEMAVLCDIPRTAAIGAKSDLEVLRIDRDAFLKLLSEFSEVSLQVMRFLAARLEATTKDLGAAQAEINDLKGG